MFFFNVYKPIFRQNSDNAQTFDDFISFVIKHNKQRNMSLEDNISAKSRNTSSESLSCDYEIIQSQNSSAFESAEDLKKVKSVFYCEYGSENSKSKITKFNN